MEENQIRSIDGEARIIEDEDDNTKDNDPSTYNNNFTGSTYGNKSNANTIINNESNSVCSLSNNIKNPRSGLLVGSIEKATIPVKPM